VNWDLELGTLADLNARNGDRSFALLFDKRNCCRS